VIDDFDIYRAAKLLVDQCGAEAARFTNARADELLQKGDIDGAIVWRRILAAVEELQLDRREGERLN